MAQYLHFVLEDGSFNQKFRTGRHFKVIGWPGVVGCSLFIAFIPMQTMLTRPFARFRRRSAIFGDERVKLMQEIIEGIRVIKMYVWEASFARVISRLRLKGFRNVFEIF